jgi:hypothetical protein
VDVVEVTGPDGDVHLLYAGDRVVFGRGPDVDIAIGKDPWLSRRLGAILVLDGGVRITNLSKKIVLHVRTRTESFPLPVVLTGADEVSCLLSSGSALVGSAASLEQRRAVHIATPERWSAPLPESPVPPAPDVVGSTSRNLSTERRLSLNKETKGFMVALLLCRPWLEDPQRIVPLPTVPEIMTSILEVTSAHHLIRQMHQDHTLRDTFINKIKGQIKELREKLSVQGLTSPDSVVGVSVIASSLIHYDILTRHDLELLNDTHWLSVQENKWWNV